MNELERLEKNYDIEAEFYSKRIKLYNDSVDKCIFLKDIFIKELNSDKKQETKDRICLALSAEIAFLSEIPLINEN